jgi:hypothetical protein
MYIARFVERKYQFVPVNSVVRILKVGAAASANIAREKRLHLQIKQTVDN